MKTIFVSLIKIVLLAVVALAVPRGNILYFGARNLVSNTGYVDFPAPLNQIALGAPISITFWLSSDDIGQDQRPIFNINNGTSCSATELIVQTVSGAPSMDLGGACNVGAITKPVFSSLGSSNTRWIHVALVVDHFAGTVASYINGLARGAASQTKTYGTNTGMRLGNRLTGSAGNAQGYMDELRIWGRVLSQQEVIDDMSNSVPNSNSLWGWWDMESSTTAVIDRTLRNNGTLISTAAILASPYVVTVRCNATNNLLYTGQSVDIYVTMSSAVTVNMVPSLTLNAGVLVNASYVGPSLGTSATVMTFRYLVDVTHSVYPLNYADIFSFNYPEYVTSASGRPSLILPPLTDVGSLRTSFLAVNYNGTTPDSSSLMYCDQQKTFVNTSITCTIIPRSNGFPIATVSSSFFLSASAQTPLFFFYPASSPTPSLSNISISALSPASALSDVFTFTVTATVCSSWYISNNVTFHSQPVHFVTPTTPSIAPTEPVLPLLTSTRLAFPLLPSSNASRLLSYGYYGQRGSANPAATVSMLSVFNVSNVAMSDGGSGGSFTVSVPLNAMMSATTAPFAFIHYYVGTQTGVRNITANNVTLFSINVYDTPDSTSSLLCVDTSTVGATITCTITARKAGASVYTRSSFFTSKVWLLPDLTDFYGPNRAALSNTNLPSLVSLTPVTPVYGSVFSFNITFNMYGGQYRVWDGVSDVPIDAPTMARGRPLYVFDQPASFDLGCITQS